MLLCLPFSQPEEKILIGPLQDYNISEETRLGIARKAMEIQAEVTLELK